MAQAKKKKTTKKKTGKKTSKKKTTRKKTRRNGMGRPTKFTPETREKIYANLHECPFYTAASEAAGISRECFRKWYRQGEHDYNEELETDYAEFFVRVRQLAAVAEIDTFKVIKLRARKDWNAARYILQCLDGRVYGQKAAVKVEDNETDKNDSAFEGANLHAILANMVAKHESEE